MTDRLTTTRAAIETRLGAADFSDVDAMPAILFERDYGAEPTEGEWVLFTIRHNNNGRLQDTLGRRGERRFSIAGIVLAEVFSFISDDNLDENERRVNVIAMAIADVFDSVNVGIITFSASNVRESPPRDKWYRRVVEAPFTYYETR